MADNLLQACYRALLGLYPAAFRERFGESMEQTFRDLCRERREAGECLLQFVVWAFLETFVGILGETRMIDAVKTLAGRPKLAALLGFLCATPFLALNGMVGQSEFNPAFAWIREWGINDLYPFGLGFVVFASAMLLMALGAWIAARPALRPGGDEGREWRLLNAAVAALLLIGFVVITGAAAEEIYRCDILKTPNGD